MRQGPPEWVGGDFSAKIISLVLLECPGDVLVILEYRIYNCIQPRMLIDSHCHILPSELDNQRTQLLARDATFASLFSRADSPTAPVESLIDAMDRAGVSRAVVMGMGWTSHELARRVNDYVIESVQRFPARLTGFCSVNPAWGDEAIEEVERCVAGGVRGIGELHPDTQGFDIADSQVLTPLMGAAGRLELPVLVHASEPVGHQYPGKGRTTRISSTVLSRTSQITPSSQHTGAAGCLFTRLCRRCRKLSKTSTSTPPRRLFFTGPRL